MNIFSSLDLKFNLLIQICHSTISNLSLKPPDCQVHHTKAGFRIDYSSAVPYWLTSSQPRFDWSTVPSSQHQFETLLSKVACSPANWWYRAFDRREIPELWKCGKLVVTALKLDILNWSSCKGWLSVKTDCLKSWLCFLKCIFSFLFKICIGRIHQPIY